MYDTLYPYLLKPIIPLSFPFHQSEGNSFKSFIPARNIWHLRIKQLRIKHSRVTYAINPVNGTPLRHISPSDSDRVLFDACTPAHNTSCCHTTRSSSSSSSSSSSLGEDLRPTSIQDKIRAHLPVMESLFIQYVTSRVKYWNCGGHSSKSWWRNLSNRGVLSRFLLRQWLKESRIEERRSAFVGRAFVDSMAQTWELNYICCALLKNYTNAFKFQEYWN